MPDQLIYVVIGLGVALCLIVPLVMLAFMKNAEKVALDNYGRHPGQARLASFSCPTCLHRSYARSHIERRYCVRCDRTYPEKPKIWKPEEKPGA